MTTTGLGRRVAALTAHLIPPDDDYARRLREMAAAERARADLRARVPEDLRADLAAGFADPDRGVCVDRVGGGPVRPVGHDARRLRVPAGTRLVAVAPAPGLVLGPRLRSVRAARPLAHDLVQRSRPAAEHRGIPDMPGVRRPDQLRGPLPTGRGHMTLSARLAKLEAAVPHRRTDLPADPLEFIHGLATGRLTAADIDRTDADLMSLLATAAAVLAGRSPGTDRLE